MGREFSSSHIIQQRGYDWPWTSLSMSFYRHVELFNRTMVYKIYWVLGYNTKIFIVINEELDINLEEKLLCRSNPHSKWDIWTCHKLENNTTDNNIDDRPRTIAKRVYNSPHTAIC